MVISVTHYIQACNQYTRLYCLYRYFNLHLTQKPEWDAISRANHSAGTAEKEMLTFSPGSETWRLEPLLVVYVCRSNTLAACVTNTTDDESYLRTSHLHCLWKVFEDKNNCPYYYNIMFNCTEPLEAHQLWKQAVMEVSIPDFMVLSKVSVLSLKGLGLEVQRFRSRSRLLYRDHKTWRRKKWK